MPLKEKERGLDPRRGAKGKKPELRGTLVSLVKVSLNL